MDVLNDELLHLWRSLSQHGVAYIMIGGFAVRFHGYNRSTDDLDIWLEDTQANRKALRIALEQAGFGDMPYLETIEFLPGWSSIYMGEGIELDILTKMKGLEDIPFSECLQQASIAIIDDVEIPFLHINHLITNKQTTNRPKDQLDVLELEQIRSIRQNRQQQ